MAEYLTFANYSVEHDGKRGIYAIGRIEEHKPGVAEEIAAAFGHELSILPSVDNLGYLISEVGPAKELQDNIARVQDVLGTNDNAATIARKWAIRSGLLTPVERSYYSGVPMEDRVELAVITGGVRNWMARRADRLEALHRKYGVSSALLAAGNRVMKLAEGTDVIEDMTEADYMKQVVAERLASLHIATTIVEVDSGVGDQVMEAGAQKAAEMVDLNAAKISVVSNAGAWVQNAGQFRRAVRKIGGPKFDQDGRQLFAVSDSFPLGTGAEPASTHQNPFSAAGQIVRNLQELVKQL